MCRIGVIGPRHACTTRTSLNATWILPNRYGPFKPEPEPSAADAYTHIKTIPIRYACSFETPNRPNNKKLCVFSTVFPFAHFVIKHIRSARHTFTENASKHNLKCDGNLKYCFSPISFFDVVNGWRKMNWSRDKLADAYSPRRGEREPEWMCRRNLVLLSESVWDEWVLFNMSKH